MCPIFFLTFSCFKHLMLCSRKPGFYTHFITQCGCLEIQLLECKCLLCFVGIIADTDIKKNISDSDVQYLFFMQNYFSTCVWRNIPEEKLSVHVVIVRAHAALFKGFRPQLSLLESFPRRGKFWWLGVGLTLVQERGSRGWRVPRALHRPRVRTHGPRPVVMAVSWGGRWASCVCGGERGLSSCIAWNLHVTSASCSKYRVSIRLIKAHIWCF